MPNSIPEGDLSTIISLPKNIARQEDAPEDNPLATDNMNQVAGTCPPHLTAGVAVYCVLVLSGSTILTIKSAGNPLTTTTAANSSGQINCAGGGLAGFRCFLVEHHGTREGFVGQHKLICQIFVF